MTVSNGTIEEKILADFLNGKSAEAICRYYNIMPVELVELFNSTKLTFPNELFDDAKEQQISLSQVQYENLQLKEEQDKLDKKIKEYEIEIRIHKEVLNTLLVKK